ncbi:MAG: diguanylate cyclase domain-containing protein, partial [Alcaligenes sp.]
FQEALHCAERLRAAVADTVRAPDLATPVTMSLGVAAAIGAENWESLFRRADENLYAAKRAGRNQVAA